MGPAERRAGPTAAVQQYASPALAGGASAVAAFLLWGFAPLYFKAVSHVPPLEVLAHRVLWAAVLLAVLVVASRRSAYLAGLLRRPRSLALLAVGAGLIALNWGTFIWAVTVGRVAEVALGYFLNPLLNVALGVAVLGERLRPLQALAVLLAAAGVAVQVVQLGELPAVSLVLAGSFAAYGLLHKRLAVEGPTALCVEVWLLLPIAVAGLAAWPAVGPGGAFLHADRATALLLPIAGAITAAPLMFYISGAKRLRYATLGIAQYLAPSCQLLLALAIFGETVPPAQWATFAGIWAGLALYTVDLSGRSG